MTREEIAESLKLLKEQARKSHNDTAILNVKIESFEWVIESAIQALSQEPTSEMVHVETLHQVMWERDIAIEQLHELGYGFGQKIEPCEDAISREAAINIASLHCLTIDETVKAIKNLPSVTQTSGKCKNCKYFEYDSVAKVDGIPLIVAHEICNKWGNGCKTSEDGYCYLFEPQESEEV